MNKDIEIRVVVPQKHTQAEFDAICGITKRVRVSGELYDIDSFYCEEDWDGPEWTPIDSEDL